MARGVECGHHLDRAGEPLGRGRVALHGGRDHAEADRFREEDRVARTGAGVGEHCVGMHGADDRHAVLGLGVVDRVPAGDEAAGRARHGGAAPVEHPGEQLERQALAWPRHEVQREQWRAAHRVDVATTRWSLQSAPSRRGRRRSG